MLTIIRCTRTLSGKALILLLMLLGAGCATQPRAMDTSLAGKLQKIYECAWYQHALENKSAADRLVAEAVEFGKVHSLDAGQILQAYGTTRSNQKHLLNERAVAIASGREAKVPRIMGDDSAAASTEGMTSTQADRKQALHELYDAQCAEPEQPST